MAGKKNLDMSFPLRDGLRLHFNREQIEKLERIRESWVYKEIKRGTVDLNNKNNMVLFMKVVNRWSKAEPIAHCFVHDYLDAVDGWQKMVNDYYKLITVMRRRFGRNFKWKTTVKSYKMVDMYLRRHHLTMNEKIDIYSSLLILNKMVVWIGWREEHVMEKALENVRRLGIVGVVNEKGRGPDLIKEKED